MASSDRPEGSPPVEPESQAESPATTAESPPPPATSADLQQLTFAKRMLEQVSEGILALDHNSQIVFYNQVLMRLFGFSADLLRRGPTELFAHMRTQLKDPDTLNATLRGIVANHTENWQGLLELSDGRQCELTVRWLHQGKDVSGRIWLIRDVTEERKNQAALRASEANLRKVVQEQERLINTIREIGTPVLPIYNQILVLPLVGQVESSRSSHLMDALLEAIARHQARVVIIDITGVSLVDTSVANSLIQSTQAAALLGAHCVLVGISASVARTIVQLGVDLSLVTTRRDLQAGIAFALRHVGYAITATKQEPDWLNELDLSDSAEAT